MRAFLKHTGVLAISAMALAASGPAFALPDSFTVRWYYTDASKTVEAGDYIETCSGRRYLTGTATAYYDEVQGSCERGAQFCDISESLEEFLACVEI